MIVYTECGRHSDDYVAYEAVKPAFIKRLAPRIREGRVATLANSSIKESDREELQNHNIVFLISALGF